MRLRTEAGEVHRFLAGLATLLAIGVGLPTALGAQAARDAVPDRGIGVIHFRSDLVHVPERARQESLLVRSAPAPSAPLVGCFVRDESSSGSAWSYGIGCEPEGRPPLEPANFEFGYEIDGLPIDSILPPGAWARVILAYDSAGRPRIGWAAVDTAQVGIILWRDALPEQGWLFFAGPGPRPVLDAPGGRELRADAVFAPDGSHSLSVEETRGDWMKVRIVSPDDSCGAEPEDPRVTTGWIRYLDARGRPLVWYHTRGC